MRKALTALALTTCLLALGGCFSADPRGVIRGVKNLQPEVEKRDRQIEELASPEAREVAE